jgi:predicted ester cyclase
MSANQLETMTRAYLDEVFNRHDLSRLDRYMSADLVSTWFGDRTLHGLPAWRDAMAGFFAAFPDAAFTLDDIFFAGDKGAWRGTWRATQRGAWEGIASTGRTVSWTVIIIGRFAAGKMVEDWVEYDRYKMLSQLGAIHK